MRARDVIVAIGLGAGDQIQISPPFVITEGEIDELVGALDETLDEIVRSLARIGAGR
jgi:adenosylmethionine-8-amino-7-oxononanoate aminotransferase